MTQSPCRWEGPVTPWRNSVSIARRIVACTTARLWCISSCQVTSWDFVISFDSCPSTSRNSWLHLAIHPALSLSLISSTFELLQGANVFTKYGNIYNLVWWNEDCVFHPKWPLSILSHALWDNQCSCSLPSPSKPYLTMYSGSCQEGPTEIPGEPPGSVIFRICGQRIKHPVDPSEGPSSHGIASDHITNNFIVS